MHYLNEKWYFLNENRTIKQKKDQRCFFIFLSLISFSACANADELSGAYAKLLSMHAVDDISASGLHTGGDKYFKLSVPWRSDCVSFINEHCIGIYMKGSYLDVKAEAVYLENIGRAQIHWQAYGITLGGDMTFVVTDQFSVRTGLGVGYSDVYNPNKNVQSLLEWNEKKSFFRFA